VFPAGNFGLSWAAFMLGMPTTVTNQLTSQFHATSPWVGTFVQDTWRLSSKLSLTAGIRYEYEDGVTETKDQMVVGFDPTTTLSITQLAEAAYAAAPIPQRAPSTFKVRGGPIYASGDGTSWGGQSMWMPRVSGAYSLTDKMVLKAGYGVLRHAECHGVYLLQTGFSQNTTSDLSGLGQTFLLGDPKRGISPMPIRSVQANGQRFQSVLGNSLGEHCYRREPHGSQFNPSMLAQRWRQRATRDQRNGGRGRPQRQLGSPRRHHSTRLPARRVVQREQRPGSHAAESPERQRVEPVLHRQLPIAEDEGSPALRPHGR
jgi:hypothetical protein